MFIQVITGTTKDPNGLRRQGQTWREKLQPGAVGYLGTTAGVTDDGRYIVLSRWESEAAARKNSDRPEQGEFFAEMQKVVDTTEFHESSDIIMLLGGGKDDAGFVQVMRGRVTDPAKLEQLRGQLPKMEELFSSARPDVVGEIIALHDDGTYTDAVYFSSEEAARAGEAQEMPPEAQAMFEELMTAVAVDDYLDLKDPDLH